MNYGSALTCEMVYAAPVLIHDNARATQLYRIAQEAVNKAIKHGQPKQIVLRLTRHDGQIELAILDDGVGISESPPAQNGMGLSIMKYRAKTIGGTLKITRRTRGGTAVSCVVSEKQPLDDGKKAGDTS